MKTMGLVKYFPLFLSAMMAGGTGAEMGSKPPVQLHSHGSSHKRGTFKGYMRENRRCTFNKNR